MRGTGRIYKRGRIYWIDWWHAGRNYRESSKSTLERDARALLQTRLGDAVKGRAPHPGRITVGDLLDEYLRDHEDNARTGLRQTRGHTRPVRASLGLDPAQALNSTRIQGYIRARLGLGLAPATVNLELRALARAYSLALRKGVLTFAPHVPILDVKNARQGFWPRSEFLAVRAFLPPDLADFADWAFWTGMRKGEAAGIGWGTVDWETKTLTLPDLLDKAAQGRVIPLLGHLEAILRRREAQRVSGLDLVFHWRNRPIKQFRKTWAKACALAGYTGPNLFHDLRRTGVRNLIRAGVPRKVAMAISGHKTESVFERYNIVDGKDLTNAVQDLQRYMDRLDRDKTGTGESPAAE
jgi:integrase